MAKSDTNLCPICGSESAEFNPDKEVGYQQVECTRCGEFRIDHSSLGIFKDDTNFPEMLSHWVCKHQKRENILTINQQRVKKLKGHLELPNPKEQADNLIKFVGDQLDKPHEKFTPTNIDFLCNYIGSVDIDGLAYILDHLQNRGLINHLLTSGDHNDISVVQGGGIKITFEGWEYYHQLNESGGSYDRAFMAMEFNNDRINKAYEEFKDAVKSTGFKLFNLQEEPKPGLIDNRLRTEIRNCEFLLADLTQGNNGAYWEAGFAEGLGKPVIYLCEKGFFEDEEKGPHFDTNHHYTVIYNHSNLEDACNELKATIRAALPHKAKMEDD